jgi:hypothetical protein
LSTAPARRAAPPPSSTPFGRHAPDAPPGTTQPWATAGLMDRDAAGAR